MLDKKTHWQNIYQDKSTSDVSWYQKEPKLSLQLIHKSGVKHDSAIIDVGGGASVLVEYLYQKGFNNLSVLDISQNALANNKKRLGDLAKMIKWYEADITEFNPPQSYSLWHDRAVFHFLTDQADRKKYVKTLQKAIKTGGHVIIAAFAVGGPEKCSGLQIVQYDASKLKQELGQQFELLEERKEVHITPSNKEQRFTYFRFIKH